MRKSFTITALLISALFLAQENTNSVNLAFFDGTAVAGYIDHGAFINFTGPNVSFTHKKTKYMLGMLPSLRIKEDHSSGTKNSMVTPNLGAGFAVIYRKLVLQIPFYYNAKTAAQNGKWEMGVGLGYRFR